MKKNIWSRIFIALLIGLPVLYVVAGFWLAPVLAKNALEKRVAGMIGHEIAVSRIKINPLEFTVEAENVAVNDPERGPLFSLQRLFVDFEISSLFLDTTVVARIILEQPWVNIVLAENGDLNLAQLAPPSETKETPEKPSAPPKPILIESIAIREASVLFEDLSSAHPVRHIFEPINIELEQVSTRINALGLSEITILTEDGERALINTQFSLEPLRLRSTMDIENFNMQRVNTHLSGDAPLRVKNGRFNLNGRLTMDQGSPTPDAIYFQGGIQLAHVAVTDREETPVVGFEELSVPSIDLSLADAIAAVDRVTINGLWVEAGLDAQGQLSPGIASPQQENEAADTPDAGSGQEFKFHLGELAVNDGYIQFDDRSLSPPVHMELSEFHVRLNNVTNLADDPTDVRLNAVINNTAKAHVEGKLKPFAAEPDIDMKFTLEDYDLIKMSAYAGKFIGYEIDRGKLGVAASYVVRGGNLEADHAVNLSHLTLGGQVESPEAVKAPVKLALSLLEDSQNRIELKLPVNGDLNSPEFSLGSVIRKSLSNVLTKIVSSPFSILGNIAGVKSENLDYVGFYPGTALLTEDEQKKLINIGHALGDRPRLVITLHPAIDKKADLLALKTQRFDQQIEQETDGRHHGHEPKHLKKLYKKRFGSKEYSRKLENFREKQDELDNPQVRFIEALRQDLIDEQPVDEGALDSLARERAQNVQKFLTQQAHIDAERLTIGKTKSSDVSAAGLIQNKFSLTSK